MNPSLDSGFARASATQRFALNTGCVAMVAACAAFASALLVGDRVRSAIGRAYSKARPRNATPCPPRRRASARSERARPPIA